MASRLVSRSLSQAPRLLRTRTRLSSAHIRPWFSTNRVCNYSATAPRGYAVVEKPSASRTKVISTPSPEYIEEEEIDVELIPEDRAELVVTDRAAQQLKKIAEREGNSDAALRIAVESGGCHGYQYRMEVAKTRAQDDYLFTHPSIHPSNIVVDAVSLGLLNGSTIDYATELIGSSFRIANNPHSKGSGCGCGVSWELKI
ncbi:[4Fe-4S] proteins maturation [Paramarasmius palmivorus]|uniref:[4Fe-4S] proteins maturation n=1 Tax=Paramarasmius palmivorus TaxID=297713 RepID=A0AAW0D539_9AGAR